MMPAIHSVSVFCGSSAGNDVIFYDQAYALGQFCASKDITIVYGGAKVGLMGAMADGTLAANGRVVGIIPDFIKNKEIAHEGLTELIEVKSMHERKTLMYHRSEGAIILPGGFGTMDEMFELLTWGQLGLHTKPIGILNIGGYYTELMKFLDIMVEKNFLRIANREMVLIADNIEELFVLMENYVPQVKAKWISPEQV